MAALPIAAEPSYLLRDSCYAYRPASESDERIGRFQGHWMTNKNELEPKAASDATERLLSRLETLDPEAPDSVRKGSAKVVKAQRVLVHPDMTVAQGFQTIVAACIRHFRFNEPAVIEHRHVEALHQVRVAMRRLRSALSLFRPAIADANFKRLRGELRWFTGELGEARNLDIVLGWDLPDGERERLERNRDRAYQAIIAAMESPRFRNLMLDLVSWVSDGDWRRNSKASEPLGTLTNRRIDRLWRKVSKARKLGAMDDRETHRLRIQVKKLRYALDFVAALHVHGRQKKFGKAMEKIQEALGRCQDLTMARSFLGPQAASIIELEGGAKPRRLRDAKQSLRRLRKIGPYWRDRRV